MDSFDAPYYNAEKSRPRQHQYNYLRLIWEERGTVLEYSLRYNTTRRGFWISSPPLPGSVFLNFKKQTNRNKAANNDNLYRFSTEFALYSVYWNASSHESSWKSFGLNILSNDTERTSIFHYFIQETKYINS